MAQTEEINKEIFTKVKAECREPSKISAVLTVGQAQLEARKGKLLK